MSRDIVGLGYVGIQTNSLEDWRGFGKRLLGLQLAEDSRSGLRFRMDDASHRFLVREGRKDGPDYYGWELVGPIALQSLAARLEGHGHRVTALTAVERAERRVSDGVWGLDPDGNRMEFFHGPAYVSEPFAPGRPISGFRTGALGMGHVVLNVRRIEDLAPFYTDILGFGLSDFTATPFRAYFFHTNERHHSLALVQSGLPGLHHLMVELRSLDDIGQAYDLAQLEEERVAVTLGRHSNDHMTSFYMRTPSKFMIEYGWGGRDIDPATWQPQEMHLGPSLWGHDRNWLSLEQRSEALRLRLAAASRGMRVPVRVLPEYLDPGLQGLERIKEKL